MPDEPQSNIPTIKAGAAFNPEAIKGTSPGDVSLAPAKPNAVAGNPFDAFDRRLAEAAAAPTSPAPASTPAPPVASPGESTPAVTQPAPSPAAPFDPDKLPADFRPKAEHWKTVNAERQRLREELAVVKKQIEELGDINTLKGLAAEKAELEKQLRMVAAERDPEMQRTFNTQRESLIEEAKSAVPGEVVAKVESILKRHGAAAAPHLRDLIREHELDAFAQSQLASVVSGLRAVEANRERLVRESAENWNKLVTEQRLTSQRQQEQAQRQLQQALEERLALVQKENPLFQPRDEAEKPEVEEAIAVAKRVATGEVDMEERLNVALSAAAYPRLAKAYQRLYADYSKLQSAAQSLRGAQPGAGERTGVPAGGDATEVPKESGRGRDAGDVMERLISQRGVSLPL